METAPNQQPEKPKSSPNKTAKSKDFAGCQRKVSEIKFAEAEVQVSDFLEMNQIADSEISRRLIDRLLAERRAFEQDFSLFDFSEDEIERIRKQSALKQKQKEWSDNKKEATLAESLVEEWKASGHSNYEVLQKLIAAHDSGEVSLLSSKAEQFKQFFGLLQSQQFSSSDTSRIIEVVNNGNVDFTQPNAFDQMIFAIYEDDKVSQSAKAKIHKKFRLFPIDTGDDLRDNLRIKQQQVRALQHQRKEASESLQSLNHQYKSLEAELADLRKQVLAEQDLDKRLILEKQYDRLESRIQALEKEREAQKETVQDLQEKEVTSSVFLRGVEADLKDGRIFVQLPKSEQSLSVPADLGNRAIASMVNAYLVNAILTPLGLEQYFFYQSDFTGDFPHPSSIQANDLFLYRLGLAWDGQILRKTDMKELNKQLHLLMKPEEYRVDKTINQNAELRLEQISLAEKGELKMEEFAKILRS